MTENNGKMGLVHIYTGDGKGKTTAAIGLAVRAAGAGKKVVFAQFMKGSDTSELKSLSSIEGITIVRSSEDLGWFNADDKEQAARYTEVHNRILDEVETLIMNGQCDVLILDEATYPYNYGIIDKERLENLFETYVATEQEAGENVDRNSVQGGKISYDEAQTDKVSENIAKKSLTCDNAVKVISDIEIVVTGRNADSFFVERADYITEMRKVRHPFDQGIQARLGIEY